MTLWLYDFYSSGKEEKIDHKGGTFPLSNTFLGNYP